ncbi:Ku protein [bacterium]|nr:Ku protein [bacterium]
MRAIWKGHIRFSLVTIPIRIYNAVDSDQKISFNQLHKEDHGPVGYEKKCKKCNKVLASDEIVKGYQYEPEQYVIVQPEDIEKIKLKSTRIIEIEGFINASEVHETLYESPYFAGPDGIVAAKTYALLSETLKQSGKVGIGKVVLRDREDVIMIAPHGHGILLHKLRHPNEVRKIENVPQIESIKINKDELKLALNLVESMTTEMKELDLNDRYNGALRDMIEAKIAGKEVVTVAEEEKPIVDIMTALKQSIEQAKSQKKPMEKAKGEKQEAAEVKPKAKRKSA